MIEAQLIFDLIIVLLIASAYVRIANLKADVEFLFKSHREITRQFAESKDKTGADFAVDLVEALRRGGMTTETCSDCGEMFVRQQSVGGNRYCWKCRVRGSLVESLELEPPHSISEIGN